VIIIDNMPQNFKLQKENGIFIHTFWGEDPNDSALKDLMQILEKIAQEKGDLRILLQKYKDEIVKKVSSNLQEK
jgi:CTD small phosphatase-like protein 2